MKLAIDSNRYTDLCVGVQHAAEVIRSAEEIHVPLIVLGELRAGFAHGARRESNESLLTRFLNARRTRVVAPDEQTTHFYADIYSELRKKGRPIPTNDLWIAALVLQHDLVLFDRDSHFDQLPRLARIR
jgi:predicted nucleic acid-binding protein